MDAVHISLQFTMMEMIIRQVICVSEIKDTLNELVHNGEVQEFKVWSDTDVYDSCGLDIYYIAVTWIGKHGELNICGVSLENY